MLTMNPQSSNDLCEQLRKKTTLLSSSYNKLQLYLPQL